MTNDVPKGKFGILEVFWQRKADKMAEGRGRWASRMVYILRSNSPHARRILRAHTQKYASERIYTNPAWGGPIERREREEKKKKSQKIQGKMHFFAQKFAYVKKKQ